MANEEKYILFNLEEDKSKDLANVISNTTSRKLLNFLADKEEASETEIAKELKLPLSTVHYNLQQLKKSKLVETKHFMYSDKGKKIEYYSVVKKFIVIAPSYSSSLLKKLLPLFLISAGISFIIQKFYGFTTKTLSYTQDVVNKIPEGAQGAASSAIDKANEETTKQIVNIVTQIPNYYGYWFLIGSWTILLIYLVINLIKKRR